MTLFASTALKAPVLSHNAHPNPPYDDESLKKCVRNSWELLTEDKRWRQDFIGLHLRTMCLPKTLTAIGFNAVAQVVNVATMHPLDPIQTPELASAMDFATRAGVAAMVLYRRTPKKLTQEQYVQLDWAIASYRSHIVRKVEKLDTHDTVEDLRFLASSCMLREKTCSHNRDWSVLIPDDIRWCLAAGKDDWPMLMEIYPKTREYLEAFAVLCELVSPVDALRRVWYTQTPVDQLALPDFDAPMV